MSVVALDAPYLIHALPGRLRVHLPGRSEAAMRAAKARLRGVAGVRQVDINRLTGNALIHYAACETDEATILAALGKSRHGAGTRSQRQPAAHRSIGNKPIHRSSGENHTWHAGDHIIPIRGHFDLLLSAARLVVDLLLCDSPLALLLVAAEALRLVMAQ